MTNRFKKYQYYLAYLMRGSSDLEHVEKEVRAQICLIYLSFELSICK